MPSHEAIPSPLKRAPPVTTPSKTLQQNAFKVPSSPPRTPLTQATRTPRARHAQRPLRVRAPLRETFLDDITPVEAVGNNEFDELPDDKDPHDLSFSPTHITRASIVDNLLLSLDQFSSARQAGLGVATMAPSRPREPPMGSLPYQRSGRSSRRRCQSLSSSVSSDNDLREDEYMAQHSKPSSRNVRSNSASNVNKALQALPSIRAEDEPTTRNRVYEAQRAEHPTDRARTSRGRSERKGSKGSASSSIDLGQMLASARLGPRGNRRSQSFDFGSRPHAFSAIQGHAAMDATPVPTVKAGPGRTNAPPSSYHTPLQTTHHPIPAVQRPSIKSSKSHMAKKPRSGLASAVVRGKTEDLTSSHLDRDRPPPLPSYHSAPALSSVYPEHKDSFASSCDSAPLIKDRPGFFRRVFGTSSKTSHAPNLDRPASQSMSRELPRSRQSFVPSGHEGSAYAIHQARLYRTVPNEVTLMAGPNGNHAQASSKKSSTFFRRRKKSISDIMTGRALPVLQDTVKTELVHGESSPVSSLMKVMDPFLLGNRPPSSPLPSPRIKESGAESDQWLGSRNSIIPIDISDSFDPTQRSSLADVDQNTRWGSSPLPPTPGSKYGTQLKVPRPDRYDHSFLANSSGTEDSSVASQRHTPSPTRDRPRRSPTFGVSPWKPSFDRHFDGLKAPCAAGTTLETGTLSTFKGQSNEARQASQADELSTTRASESDVTIYKSALSTPVLNHSDHEPNTSFKSVAGVANFGPAGRLETEIEAEEKDQALRIFENRDECLTPAEAAAWLGDSGSGRERIREAYMELFDWTNLDILDALRSLCTKIVLKGETQQVDRMLDALAKRWCLCNVNHGFKSSDVVHTICYSILLLNTDLHVADIGQKMTRPQFVRNTLLTLRRVASDCATDTSETLKVRPCSTRYPIVPDDTRFGRASQETESTPISGLSRPTGRLTRENSEEPDIGSNETRPLVSSPFTGSTRGWESQIETVLKSFHASISKQRLPLCGVSSEATDAAQASGTLLAITGNMLRRTPSTLSKAASETYRGRNTDQRFGTGARWTYKGRSRPRLYPVSTVGSSRTSFDGQSSIWSPPMSSTWSKTSLGKTLTSMSVDSLGSDTPPGDYQKAIGFANALSQAIIREDKFDITGSEEGMKAAPLLDDESLELSGAPWAKEGIIKHKHHLDSLDRKAKDRNWNDCFAVIEKGWMRLFSFSANAKSVRQRAKDRQKAVGVVGGGNWMDNAEEVWKILLRHTIASELPPPGYSKARPFVWALSLPTGAVHLFSVGTPDIVEEFVTTANYWSARLSKQPVIGGISNMEYGWSDAVINRALVGSESHPSTSGHVSRPSLQGSTRNSFDHHGGSIRPKLPGDKVTISDWSPPQQSMTASQLMEVDQLKGLQTYVKKVEEDLQKHNELRPAVLLAFSPRHPNAARAMTNWEKKSAHLLREIVKFRTYIDSLRATNLQKEKIYAMRREDDQG